ncbi:MAG: hypothetical protein SF162_08895 [bacterium]|nr:hypothetical protein [bacterium]
MSDNQKRYKTEWSFSFDKLGDEIRDFFQDVGTNAEDEIKSAVFDADLAGAAAARVRLDLSVGEASIHALAESDKAIIADLVYVGDIRFSAETDPEGVRVINLSQSAGAKAWFRGAIGWFGSKRSLRWNIGLTRQVPMELDIRGGVGESTLDLRGLQLKNLHIAVGAGEMTVMLPAGTYEANIDGGVGEVEVHVETGAHVDLSVGGGVGELNLNVADGATVASKIRGGVGEVNVRLPETTPASLTVKAGLGGVSFTPRFVQVSGSNSGFDRSGTWQTPGFEGAVAETRPNIIHYDGGVGAFNVR